MTLTEHIWSPADDVARSRRLLPYLERPDLCERAYAVTAGSDGPHLFGTYGDSAPTDGTPFADHLRRHPPRSFWDAAYVATAFTLPDPTFPAETRWYAPHDRLDFDFEPVPLVDDLLGSSRGTLIWAHQMEQLAALGGLWPDARVAFRKGINAKRADTFAEAASIEVAPGVSLRDVIDARMVFQIVQPVDLHTARYVIAASG